jgi:2-oxoglutarate dehydrogenase E2 component (dihydrolipoamide succinyltransferase)
MMEIDIIVPAVGESIKEAILVEWYKKEGESVQKDDLLFLIETDKVTVEVQAETDGALSIKAKEGDTVAIGAVVGSITAGAGTKPEAKPEVKKEEKVEQALPAAKASPVVEPPPIAEPTQAPVVHGDSPMLFPSVRRLAAQKNVDVSLIQGSGPAGRITKSDVLEAIEKKAAAPVISDVPIAASSESVVAEESVVRKPMSPIRRKIAEHLLNAKHSTAMLTTFNDIDMSRTMAMRSQYKEQFKKRHDINLGFMSFFVKASVQALMELPQINAFIDEKDIVFHNYYHIGVAIGSPRGLVVPVIRHADKLGFAGVEKSIVDYVTKVNNNKLELSHMEGGTFTITNGGVFGSLLSTPILNSPQSAILGMHKIEKRPVVVNDEIVIRPMMYVALSYDHRVVDGKEAVTFLKRIKECIENPERMMMEV